MELIFKQPHLKLHVYEQNKYKLDGTLRGGNQAVAREKNQQLSIITLKRNHFLNFPNQANVSSFLAPFLV